MPRILFFVLVSIFLTIPAVSEPVSASSALVEMIGREGCAHCVAEETFLSELADRRPGLEIVIHDTGTPEGKALFERVTATEGISKATPVTAVGGTIIQGFESAETTGRRIEDLLDAHPGADGFEGILSAGRGLSVERESGSTCEDGDVCRAPGIASGDGTEPILVAVPFLGSTDISRFSLPMLAAVLGFVDGFNPCAMWVLVTFLLVLIQFGDRRKMFFVSGLFVLAESVMYYLILNVWFTAWDFIGLDRIVMPIVGLVSVGGGAFFVYEWYRGDGTCLVTDTDKRARISGRIRKLASEPLTWVTAAGVVALALSVNVIEFACSIGIPQTFTKILEVNRLGFFGTQGLMLVYILFYMIDDLIVFGLALWGAGKLQTTHAYAKWCNLFGGILMILLGLLLVFRPEKLLF